MKTLVCWTEESDTPAFIIVEGPDIRKFHNLFINCDEDTEELSEFFYDSEGKLKHTKLEGLNIPEGHFDAIIITGIL